MEITIKIQELEGLIGAINNMADALKGNKVLSEVPAQGIQAPIQQQNQQSVQVPIQQAVQTSIPTQQPVNTYQQPMQTPQAANTQQIQTTTASYTLDDISKAAMTLLDSGKQPELLGLLAQFGVESLPALPQEQYGAFATALRGLGAQI